MIPVKCRICFFANREEGFCSYEYGKGEPKLPFLGDCEEFKFEPLFLVELLEEMVKP